jgi:hypothetical protein
MKFSFATLDASFVVIHSGMQCVIICADYTIVISPKVSLNLPVFLM